MYPADDPNIPNHLTALYAISVAPFKSLEHPAVTLFGPKNILSATNPPIHTSSIASTCYLFILSISESSGIMNVAPRAPPLATIVALYNFQAPAVK